MSERQIKEYYERIEKLLNGANKETYGFAPQEIKNILRSYEELQNQNQELKKQLEEYRKTNEHLLDKKQFLKQKNQLLKKQLEVGEEQYNDLVEEKEELQEQLSVKSLQFEELKKQLEELELQNFNLREDIMIKKMSLPNEEIKDKTFFNLYDMPTYEDLLNQQKEFIEYLESEIKYLKIVPLGCKTGYLDGKEHAYIEILSKYKEIIGVENDR